MKKKILVMGAVGQIGSELTATLRSIYGDSQVIASDIRLPNYETIQQGPFEIHDATDGARTAAILGKHGIGLIYNLPALLSATAEQFPQQAFEVNLVGLHRTLEAARQYNCAVFYTIYNRCFWHQDSKRQYPTRHHHAAKYHVRCNKGSWRIALRLLSC